MQNENPLISIIVPVYNVISYLPQCIDSLLEQTYKNIEVILVDDGSTDGSECLCDQYAEKDNRVKVIHQKNQGLGPARNTGIRTAKGSWLGFVDSDDHPEKEMFAQLLQSALQANAQIAVCGYYEDYPDFSRSCPAKKIAPVLSAEETFCEAIAEDSFESFMWNKLFQKELWEKIRFPDSKQPYEDIAVFYRILNGVTTVAYISSALYHYRQRQESLTHGKQFNKNRMILFDYYRRLLEYSKNRNGSYEAAIRTAMLLNSLRFYVELMEHETPGSAEIKETLFAIIRQNRKWIFNRGIPIVKRVFLLLMLLRIPVYRPYQYARKIKLKGAQRAQNGRT